MSMDAFSGQLHAVIARDSRLDDLPFKTIIDAIPRIDDLADLPAGTPVLVRADLDTPAQDGAIEDLSRIHADAATIEFCHRKTWRTVILGHIGRDRKTSLPPRVPCASSGSAPHCSGAAIEGSHHKGPIDHQCLVSRNQERS